MLTRVVEPAALSWTKTSRVSFVSPGTRLVASERKATNRPSALIAGARLWPFAWAPDVATLIRFVGATAPLAAERQSSPAAPATRTTLPLLGALPTTRSETLPARATGRGPRCRYLKRGIHGPPQTAHIRPGRGEAGCRRWRPAGPVSGQRARRARRRPDRDDRARSAGPARSCSRPRRAGRLVRTGPPRRGRRLPRGHRAHAREPLPPSVCRPSRRRGRRGRGPGVPAARAREGRGRAVCAGREHSPHRRRRSGQRPGDRRGAPRDGLPARARSRLARGRRQPEPAAA